MFAIIIVISTAYGIISGNIGNVSTAALESSSGAVEICLSIAGVICMWSGIMSIAEKSGITEFFSKLLSPLLSLLFKGIEKNSPAMRAISLNVISNLFGLGNASTPLGIEAMRQLEIKERPGERASTNMIMLVVLNTASIQLVPTTVAVLRLANGSAAPFDIIPAVLISSCASVSVATLSVKLFSGFIGRQK